MSLYNRYLQSRGLINSFFIATASGCLLLVAFGGCGGSEESQVVSKRARIEIPADVVPGRPEPAPQAAPAAVADTPARLQAPAEEATAPAPAPKAPVAATTPPKTVREPVESPAPEKKVAKKSSSGGTWAINVASFSTRNSASDLSDGLRKAGYNPYITEFVKDNRLWYRVRVGFFKTRDDAVATGGRIKSRFNVGSAWVVQPSSEEITAHSGN